MVRYLKLATCGMALASAAFATQAAGAVNVYLQGASISSPVGTLYATTNGNSVREYATIVDIAVNFGTGPSATPVYGSAFCVDLFHTLYVGIDSYFPTNVQYHVAPLSTDAVGNPLSASQISQISGLAAYGFGLIGSAEVDLHAKLAAIQAAIWTIEYPATAFTPDPGNVLGNLAAYTAGYVALAPSLHGTAYMITSDTPGAAQNLLVAFKGANIEPFDSAVPEPATWALTIVGFGMTGIAARRRRTGVVAA